MPSYSTSASPTTYHIAMQINHPNQGQPSGPKVVIIQQQQEEPPSRGHSLFSIIASWLIPLGIAIGVAIGLWVETRMYSPVVGFAVLFTMAAVLWMNLQRHAMMINAIIDRIADMSSSSGTSDLPPFVQQILANMQQGGAKNISTIKHTPIKPKDPMQPDSPGFN